MAGYERTVERVSQCLGRTDNVLELGCGTGTTALRLAPIVAHYAGTDISVEMIAIAREKAMAEECANLEFGVVGSDFASWPSGPFDAVLAFNLLHLVVERRSYLQHAYAALKPGGLFVSKTPCLSEMTPLIRLAVPVARLFGKAPHVSFFTAAELIDDITDAGFTLVEQARHGSKPNDSRIFVIARR
jgi:ubiquinone/menaquinone biosynthesis C-methylase UbiE